MKIAVASDLHLEFGKISLENEENAEVLILSGDICVAAHFKQSFIDFFRECSERFPHVIYIMGNHEHYDGDYQLSYQLLKDELSSFENVYLLEKEVVKIKDFTFIGGTLWTDMNKNDPNTLWHVRRVMNDFRIIRNGGSNVLTPDDVYSDHLQMIDFIKNVVDVNKEGKFVVVGHHSPSKLSIKPKYEKDVLTNGAYSSELSEFILDRPQIKLWTHGHTHETFDYMIGSTRILCNPRGYIDYEKRADEFELLFTEI